MTTPEFTIHEVTPEEHTAILRDELEGGLYNAVKTRCDLINDEFRSMTYGAHGYVQELLAEILELVRMKEDGAMEELKPCPFCGSEVELEKNPLWDENGRGYKDCYEFKIQCKKCGCRVDQPENDSVYRSEERAKKNAIKAWNRRANNEIHHRDRR